MANTLFRIYRINGAGIQVLEVSQSGQGFGGDLGAWDQVFRVDFFHPDGHLICVFPCAGGSTANVDASGVFTQFNLMYAHYLGTPNVGAEKLCLVGNLQIVNNQPFFVGTGAWIDNQPVVPNSSSGAAYVATFGQLTSPTQETSVNIDASPVPVYPPAWKNFQFGNKLFYRIRTVTIQQSETVQEQVPVFTLERDIPSKDEFGLRLLPPPFSIPIAPRTPGTGSAVVTLRAVQRPSDGWITKPDAKFESHWLIDITGFRSGTIADFWQHSVVDRYLGALESVCDSQVLSLLPRFNADSDGLQLVDIDWRLRLPVLDSKESLSLQRLGPLDGPVSPSQSIALACDGLKTHSGSGLVLKGNVANRPPEDLTSPCLGFEFTAIVPEGDTKIRLGSIDLDLDPAPDSSRAASASISYQVIFEAGSGDFWLPRISILGSLPLQDVQPGGQDDPNEPQFQDWLAAVGASGAQTVPLGLPILPFQRESALLIAVPPPKTASLLGLKENSDHGVSQHLVQDIDGLADSHLADQRDVVHYNLSTIW